MRMLVTGTAGQVVTALLERTGLERAGGAAVEMVALGRPALDLADLASIEPAMRAAFGGAAPDVVVSAAAYTAVDKAEGEHELAHAINGAGAGEVARVAALLGAPVIHISTDYVFDGTKPAPYLESDATAPMGVYGASKLAGEAAVLAAQPRSVILRTAWVYSPFGANFVKTMLRLAQTRDELGVVADQTGNPTSAIDIADGILAVARRLVAEPQAPVGVFHMSGSGEAVWADLAEAVFAAAGLSTRVRRIATSDYPTPAARPANSRLDCGKLAAAYGVRLPDWRASVQACVARLIKEREVAA